MASTQKATRKDRDIEELIRIIAIERMELLFKLGIEAVKSGDYERARHYGELIKRISMRTRVKIPKDIKRWICKHCHVVMVPGFNARVRTRRDGKALRVVTKCLSCGWIHRYEFVVRGSGKAKRISREVKEEKGGRKS
ncbi:MAG: ribonuclease P [Ignisphaera sp.]|nr:ribonuclease P [Ignisphaera sp.]